jgi:NRAMP (natural resistance-associated macrophage protein)-like metal ion transporter
MTTTFPRSRVDRGATLDSAHVGDIRGALGTIAHDDTAQRTSVPAKLKTLLAIVGPGLIVMVGDNDAGAFSVYGQAGQDYGTRLLWTFLLLIPVLYVNQEMVLRLGAVTGVGHARLILERFGRFWGAFSVIDLFILNALTIVTEFIGITLAAGYLGVPKVAAVALAALVIIATAFTGSFRRFERIALVFCIGSLLLVPVYLLSHPRPSQLAVGFFAPSVPGGSGQLATVMLLIIGIVGTTVAPWQLFFQQSYVIDKRITPRFIRYERVDLVIGIGIVILGGAALTGAVTAAFAGTAGHGHFTDAAGIAAGLAAHAGQAAGALFAIALLDASMIGAFAVSLSTAYALGDVLGLKHSLHRGFRQAKGFYAMYAGVVGLAASIVLIPGSPLGLLTEGVQALAGVLLPSATVFLLLLCNDKAVLGPWVNGRATNAFAGAVIALLITLSLILTVSVADPHLTGAQIKAILLGCAAAALAAGGIAAASRAWRRAARGPAGRPAGELAPAGPGGRLLAGRVGLALSRPGGQAQDGLVPGQREAAAGGSRQARENWRMPPLATLSVPVVSLHRKLGLSALWVYSVVAMALVAVKITQVALGH